MRLSDGLEMDAPHAGGIAPAQLQRIAVSNLVQRTLLLQRAAAADIRVTAAEADAERLRRWGNSSNTVCGTGIRDAIMDDLLVQRASADITRHVPRAGRAQCEEFYRRNGKLFDFPEAVRTQHIVCNIHTPADEVRADEVMRLASERLAAGTAFSRVADQYSDCKGVGGALGWVTRGEMVPLFEEVVFTLPVGTRSTVFRTEFGLHIALVSEYRSAGRTPFEKVRLEIAKRLHEDARKAFLGQTLAEIERASQIFVMEDEEHA